MRLVFIYIFVISPKIWESVFLSLKYNSPKYTFFGSRSKPGPQPNTASYAVLLFVVNKIWIRCCERFMYISTFEQTYKNYTNFNSWAHAFAFFVCAEGFFRKREIMLYIYSLPVFYINFATAPFPQHITETLGLRLVFWDEV